MTIKAEPNLRPSNEYTVQDSLGKWFIFFGYLFCILCLCLNRSINRYILEDTNLQVWRVNKKKKQLVKKPHHQTIADTYVFFVQFYPCFKCFSLCFELIVMVATPDKKQMKYNLNQGCRSWLVFGGHKFSQLGNNFTLWYY